MSGAVRRTALTARVVYNGMGTPRADGAVVVQEAAGRKTVVAVTSRAEAASLYPDATPADAGFALSPSPVNAHTHLDLSGMPLFRGSYSEFIRAVVAHGRSGARGLQAARAGVAELLATGVHTVGDIVTSEEVMEYLLGHEQLTGVAYWEVLGPDPADAPAILARTEAQLGRFARLERPGGMRVGLAPHTPHTVSAELLRGLAALAVRRGLPLQLHVAEDAAERDFHLTGGGPLAELLAGAAPGRVPAGTTPVRLLARLGVLEARPTLVHMVHVDEEEVRLVQRAGCTVVHCPRSNTGLGCGRFPWEVYARHGVEVALGTDSRGSSPDLSVIAEAAAARELHGERVSPLALVRAAVKGGHRALGSVPPRFGRGDDAGGVRRWDEGPGVFTI